MKVKVKICGIRTLEAAQTAVSAGADLLGFNFVIGEKRYVRPEVAKEIINKIRSILNGSQVKIIGVFQNNSLDYINKLINLLNLDFIQLHEKRIIKSTKNKVTYSLVDRKKQGTGQVPDLNKSKTLAKKFRIFFAGGLNPNNIEKVIKAVRPYGVDVSGGIETNGQHDNQKIKEFIFRAKGVLI